MIDTHIVSAVCSYLESGQYCNIVEVQSDLCQTVGSFVLL